jgi:hypothetical protein
VADLPITSRLPRSTYFRVGRAVLASRGAERDEESASDARTCRRTVGREGEPPSSLLRFTSGEGPSARSDLAAVEPLDL